ncbi:hypothetical protein BDV96DRAFT_561283, partial [Lophiotrema nucula]
MDLEEEERALGRWPRRLLYIPTLKSYPCEEGHCYNGFKEPQYDAITYTWGRFRLQESDQSNVVAAPIEITGTKSPWSIPRIDPKHFTASEFVRAIRTPTESHEGTGDSRSVDFIWLDVACIDQRAAEPRSAAEIGRQALIFHGARRVYVWLARFPTVHLEKMLTTIERGADYEKSESVEQHAVTKQYASELLSDPWFSSLWTLQETFLRPGAFLLSKDAKLISHSGETRVARYELTERRPTCYTFAFMNLIFSRWAQHCERNASGHHWTACQEMLNLIEERGLRRLMTGTELGMYEAALRRQTLYPEDRVYGIQQIFGFRLGKSSVSAQPGVNFTLEDLEDELGEALMVSKPVLSQLHVFKEPIPESRRWRFHTCSRVATNVSLRIVDPRDYGSYRRSRCSFWVDHGPSGSKPVLFSGMTIGFMRLLDGWKEMAEGLYPPFQAGSLLESWFPIRRRREMFICLDETEEALEAPATVHPLHGEMAGEWLSARHPSDDIRVLLLGLWGPSISMGLEEPLPIENGTFGLILRSCSAGTWARMGICQWDTANPQWTPVDFPIEHRNFLDGTSSDWVEQQGVFGYMG